MVLAKCKAVYNSPVFLNRQLVFIVLVYRIRRNEYLFSITKKYFGITLNIKKYGMATLKLKTMINKN